MTESDPKPEGAPEPQPQPANDRNGVEQAHYADVPPAFDPEAARAEIAELKDRVLRTMADAENMRRRLEREREDAGKYAASRFARDILSVADNLRRALDSAPAGERSPELQNLLAGIEATERELLGVFERHGIRRIEALGQKFDPNLHQAMFEVEDPAKPAGTVVQEMASGFTIAGRLLRAAMVGVSKGGPRETPVDVKI